MPEPATSDPRATGPELIAVGRRLAELSGGDPAADRVFFAELWETFSARAVGDIDELGVALRRAAAPDVARIAHSLKGSAENLGGDTFAATLRALEVQAQSDQLGAVDGVLDRIRGEFEALRDAFADSLTGLEGDDLEGDGDATRSR